MGAVSEVGVLDIGNVEGAIVEGTLETGANVFGELVGSLPKIGAFVTFLETGEFATGEMAGAVLGIRSGLIGALDGKYDSTGDADGDDAVKGAFEIVILGT